MHDPIVACFGRGLSLLQLALSRGNRSGLLSALCSLKWVVLLIGALAAGAANAQSLIIVNNSLTAQSLTIGEGDSATTSVRLVATPTGNVTLTFSTDYPAVTVSPSTTLTFNAGNFGTNQTVTINVAEDDNGANESVTVTIDPSGANYNTQSNRTVSVTVTDNDPLGLTPSLTSAVLNEGGTGRYSFVLNTEPVGGDVTLTQSVSNATSASLTPAMLTFTSSNWDTAQTLTATALEDDNGTDETGIALRSKPSGADYGGVATSTVMLAITDDDTQAVVASTTTLQVAEGSNFNYTVRLDTEPTGDVTVAQGTNNGDSARLTPAMLTFTSGNWDTGQTVTAAALPDDNASSETVNLTHNPNGADYDSASTLTVTLTTTDIDTPSIEFSTSLVSLNEQGSAGEYTVRLGTEPTMNVTVAVTSGDAAVAVAGSTNSLTFTTMNFGTAQTVTVSAPDDANTVSESVTITHTATGGDYQGRTETLTAQVTDNDVPGVLLTVPTSVTEGAVATSTARLATQPTGQVTVAISAMNETSGRGVTIQGNNPLTFNATTWNTAQTFLLLPAEDDDAQDESVLVTLNPNGGGYGSAPNATTTLTVVDNDTRALTLSESTLTVQEQRTASYTVQLATQPHPSSGRVTVAVSSTSTDITASPDMLTFTSTNWDRAQSVVVSAADDGNSDNESVTLTHTATGADYESLGVTASLLATAIDNDQPGLQVTPTMLSVAEGSNRTYTVRLNSLPTGDVTVTVSGTVTGITATSTSLTFSTMNWNTTQTVTVSAADDDNAVDETATLTHAVNGPGDYGSLAAGQRPSVTVAVNDPDTRDILIDTNPATVATNGGPLRVDEEASANYTVKLQTQPVGGNVTVTATSNSALLTLDTDSSPQTRALTFTSVNWDTVQTVAVTAVADDGSGDNTVMIAHAATNGDYAGDMKSLTVEVDDNDTPMVVFDPHVGAVTEGVFGASATTSALRLTTQPSGDVTVAITDNHLDVAVDPTMLTFTMSNWNAAQTFTVTAAHDDDGQDEPATLRANPSGGPEYDTAPTVSSALTVKDDDAHGVLLGDLSGGALHSTSTLMVNEDGQTRARYTVRLTTRPITGNVTVALSSDMPDAVTVSPTALIFSSSNWDSPQTATARAVSDVDNASETATLTHTASGADYGSPGVTASLQVMAADDDAPGLRVIPTALTLDEGTDGTYAVSLYALPTADVTVAVAGAVAGSITTQPTALTFSTSTWQTAQTVMVSALEDDNATNNATTLTHTVTGASEYATAPADRRPSVAVTTVDNDTRGIVVDINPATPAIEAGPLVVTEASSTMYTVLLSSEPVGGDVTVTAASDNAALTLGGGSQMRALTFTTTNWNMAVTVTATAAADDDGRDVAVAISHAATGGATSDYAGMTKPLAAQIRDDDPRQVMAGAVPASIGEGDTAALTAVLQAQPVGGAVTVTITDNSPYVTIVDTDATTPGTQRTLTFTMSDWNTPQAFTISVGEDDDGQDDTVTLTLNPSGADFDGSRSTVHMINLADDDIRGVTLSTAALEVVEGASANYTVLLDTEPAGGDVTVTVGGAANGITASPTMLTFTDSNWDTAQEVVVSVAENAVVGVATTTLTHAVTGADYGAASVTAAGVAVTTVDNEAAGLTVTPTELALSEGGSGAYTVRLNTEPTGDVMVTVTVTGSGVTATTTPLAFTTSTWSVAQTVMVNATADDDAMDATAILTHTASGASEYTGLSGLALPSVAVTVADPDYQSYGAEIANLPGDTNDYVALNEGGSRDFTVILGSQPVGGNVTMTVTSSDGSALAVDTDGTPQVRLLTFTSLDWDVNQTVTMMAVEDDDPNDETVTISIATTGADYNGLAWPPLYTVRVSDDDTPMVLFDPAPGSLIEGTATTSMVRLSTRPPGVVRVTITDNHPDVTVDGPTTLTFNPTTWSTLQAVSFRAAEDDDAADETATITLNPHGGGYNAAPSVTSILTLRDDDTRGVTLGQTTVFVQEGGSASYTAKLDTQPFGGVVTLTVGGAANGITANPARLAFTSSNWATWQTVVVSAAVDSDSVSATTTLTHTVTGADYTGAGVTVAPVAVTAIDRAVAGLRVAPTALALAEGGSAREYTVRLNTDPTTNVTVGVGGTIAGSITTQPTSLTFSTSTWQTLQTVTVSAPSDDNATSETTTLTHAVSSSTGDYATLALEARPGVSVTVADTDTRRILIDADASTPAVDRGPLALNEDSGHADNTQEYTVKLATQPTMNVEVSVESDDRAVEVDADSTPRTRLLTFTTTNWATLQTVTATAADDDDTQNEAATISHKASGGDYDGLLATLTANTEDDDTPAVLLATSTLGSSGVTEGGTQTYTVRLATEPGATVTVTATVTSGATARAEVDADVDQAGLQSSLRFNATNWNMARTVTVRGLEDDDAANGEATLAHTAKGADYGGVAVADTVFTVNDDDTPALLMGATALTLNEGSTATYTVRLETRPVGGRATVTAMSSTAAATVTPAMLQFGAGDWNAPKTFRVSGAQAGRAEIAHTATGADYGGVATTTVMVDVRDTGAPGVRIEPAMLALREGASGTYRVRLNTAPAGAVTVTATSGSLELEIDSDLTPLSRALTFTTQNWHVEQIITVSSLADDGVQDESETISHAVEGYDAVAGRPAVTDAPTLEVMVDDDDAAGLVFAPAGGLQLDESSSDTYTVRLRFAPATPVTVTVSSDDTGVVVDTDSGMTGDQDELAFDVGNWSTPQTVTVRADLDDDAASEAAVLRHRAAGVGSGYEGVSAAYSVRVSDANSVPAPTGVAASAAGPTSLAVRWSPSEGADEYAVQWRLAGQAWSTARQLTLPAGTLTTRIEGLTRGAEYQVRVLGLLAGDAGDPSSVVPAAPASLGPPNGSPVASVALESETLALGETLEVTLRRAFQDPNGDVLVYTALSLDPSIVDATVSGSDLVLRALSAGVATVYVWATDPGGLRASQSLQVTVQSQLVPQPPVVEEMEPLQGADALRRALTSLIRPANGDPASVSWRASSMDESLATVRVVGTDLLVEPQPGNEGTVEIVLEATDEDGRTVTLRFEVQVEFYWPMRQASGWRGSALMDAARAAVQPEQ